MQLHTRLAVLTLATLALTTTTAAQARFFWSQTKDGGSNLDDVAYDVAIAPNGNVFVSAFKRSSPTNPDALFLAYDAYGGTRLKSVTV